MNRETSRARLVKLAEFLKTVPEDRFDMSTWVWLRGRLPKHIDERESCGTGGCALGWATAIPEFRKATGIRIAGHRIFDYPEVRDRYGGVGVEAGARLFGIHLDAAEWLFSGGPHVHAETTPEEMSEVILENLEKLVDLDDWPW